MAKIGELAKIVGKKQVLTDEGVLRDYKDDGSYQSGMLPQCVVRPRNAEEVQKIVRLANEEGSALIPCSSGGRAREGIPFRKWRVPS